MIIHLITTYVVEFERILHRIFGIKQIFTFIIIFAKTLYLLWFLSVFQVHQVSWTAGLYCP